MQCRYGVGVGGVGGDQAVLRADIDGVFLGPLNCCQSP